MKKLMIAFAVVAMAACSQAAMIKWGMSATKADTPAALNGSTVYMVLSSAWDGETPWTSEADIAKAASQTAEFKISAKSATATPASAYISPDLKVGDTPTYYLILVDSDSGKYFASNLQTANAAVADGINDKDPDSGATLPAGTASVKTYAAGSALGNADNWKSMGGDVPEPTSALLMLLGVAGLALKRKQA